MIGPDRPSRHQPPKPPKISMPLDDVPASLPAKTAEGYDLEVKDAQVIFANVWGELEADYGRENLRFSKEIILLGGAPGAGKGTNTEFIAKARGLTCPPIVVSSLLTTPEAERIKQAGGMVGDREVIGILFRKLLEPVYRDGCILDGFPRTRVQVECLKLVVEKMNQLYREYHKTPLAINFRKPTVHAMVLFIDERTSIERQLQRGRVVAEHNAKVRAEGGSDFMEERDTDRDPEAARQRYRVFKEKTWDALQSLRELYHYHFVNAQGDIRDVEQNILRELAYQSSLELDPETYDTVRHIPLASEIVVHARQELVRRMDSYQLEHTALFLQVVKLIEERFMPIVRRHTIAGMAVVNSEDAVFENPQALAMLIDIFAERGYRAVANVNRAEVPRRIDLKTGEIHCDLKRIYRFQISFSGSAIRRGEA